VIAPAGARLQATDELSVHEAVSSNGAAAALDEVGPGDLNGRRSERPRIGRRPLRPLRSPRAAVRMLNACRYLDVAVVLAAVLGVFLLANASHRGNQALFAFLDMRVTVKNLLLLGIFAWVMHASLATFGLYDERRLGDPLGYAGRLVAA
jgi:hypothetical protein